MDEFFKYEIFHGTDLHLYERDILRNFVLSQTQILFWLFETWTMLCEQTIKIANNLKKEFNVHRK